MGVLHTFCIIHSSNETMQFMVKYIDNNYRTFQKERKSKGTLYCTWHLKYLMNTLYVW